MHKLKRIPVTLALLASNILVFAFCRYDIGTFSEPAWTQGLLFRGAEFGPLSLDREWYRLLTHLFLHGNFMHLLFNMYALFSVGSEIEQITGTRKYLWVYFISGFTASLASLYFNLFTIGVGASGAIFGLFGYSLVVQVAESRKNDHPVTPIVTNFIIFLVVNYFFAEALNADNSAHMGGLAGGFLMGLTSLLSNSYRTLKTELLFLPLCVVLFLALPRYQVTYFNFFQKMIAVEDSTAALFNKKGISDAEFLVAFKKQQAGWDSAKAMLDSIPYLPEKLHSDTFKLKQYISLRTQEANYRILMIENESYRYLDSMQLAQEKIQDYRTLEYPLLMMQPIKGSLEEPTNKNQLPMIQVWYNDAWEELPGEPGSFYRVGTRDSLGRWQGPVRDFFANGEVQMKGVYSDNLRDGVFIYYSDHKTYVSAGRYSKNRAVGKWEQFHYNGTLASEEFYLNDYFMKNMWDSLGNPLVINGEGTYKKYYDNGVLQEQGDYRNGKREGLWLGFHQNGTKYFEEYFNNGRLVSGRARTLDGETYIYDEGTYFPMPVGGYEKLKAYFGEEIKSLNLSIHGKVQLSLTVSENGVPTEFYVENGADNKLTMIAIQLIKDGPWVDSRTRPWA
jgi:membrane associated rhomboid family serine protease/antitoxin component YwqK of YwqJK toxin-antitoxin module